MKSNKLCIGIIRQLAVKRLFVALQPLNLGISLSQSRTQPISKEAVWSAFGKVKSKGGSEGVDGLTIEAIALRKMKYLYPIWNRLSSGSYYP